MLPRAIQGAAPAVGLRRVLVVEDRTGEVTRLIEVNGELRRDLRRPIPVRRLQPEADHAMELGATGR